MDGISLQVLAGLTLALLLGTLIGLERRLRHHAAGLHTNALVALGAAAYVSAAQAIGDDGVSRMIAQITVGIGFIGGGVIMRQGATVRGLNAAATLWCSAAVGTLAGLQLYAIAGVTAVLVLCANVLLHWLEHGPINWPPGDDLDD